MMGVNGYLVVEIDISGLYPTTRPVAVFLDNDSADAFIEKKVKAEKTIHHRKILKGKKFEERKYRKQDVMVFYEGKL